MRTDHVTGVRTVSIDEKNVRHLSEDRLERIVLAIARQGEPSIDVAISRWCKSKEGFRTLADQFIDLRAALEALYLKNFDRKNRGEMKFRLALYVARYVGSDFAERKATRTTLGDAYDMGSRAVHGDPLPSSETSQALLFRSQALCRRGILKFLEEGVQQSWDNIILGAGLDDGEGQTSE